MDNLNLENKLYLGQDEVLLVNLCPLIQHANVRIVGSEKVVNVSYTALSNKKEKIIAISLAWLMKE